MIAHSQYSGIEVADLSDEVRAQDDLFRFVNGRWFDRTEIPADKATYNSFVILFEEAEKAVRAIVEQAGSAPEGSEARKFGDLYVSFVDESAIESRGAQPLDGLLGLIDNVASIDQLLNAVGDFQRQSLAGFYGLFVNADPGDPSRYLVFVEQGGISLPDESYYREEHFAPVREAFLAHLRRMFELAGVDRPDQRAQLVFDLETEIASHHWDNVATRDEEKTYNPMAWGAASSLFVNASNAIGVTLDAWKDGLGAPQGALDEVVLREPSFIEGLAQLLDDEHLDAWRDWLRWHVIRSHAPFLSHQFVDENFDFFGRTLTGAPELGERWKRGVSLVEGAMGEAVGKIYVERHFPLQAKTRMDVLVANLTEAYRESITSLEWMSEETRRRALEKLDAFTPKIGYPVKWRDYSNLVIDADDLIANVRAIAAFEFNRELTKIGGPVDRDEWFMTPQTINAYYNPGFNEIVFPAAILQTPFFDAERDDAANYGGIGAVIGHEIGHGFDDQGSKYDGEGRLSDWWTPEDRAAFEERTAVLIEQYNELAPRLTPDLHVNGALTIGENIGDLGGLGIAWKAYLLSLDGEDGPVIDGLSAAQRFFLAWARVWRDKQRVQEVERRLAIDPHSPNEFRCNQIVRNVEPFYEAFALSPSDGLWLDPERRVTIW
ncbi:MAG: M13-type metalloendopeptidase [Acidimicrobiales bacterium]